MTETPVPGINPDLIRQYADQYKLGDPSGLTNLITLFDHLRKGELQARRLSESYLNQISRMLSDGAKINERMSLNVPSERSPTEDRNSQTKIAPGQKLAKSEPKTTREAKEKLTLDLDL